MTDFDEALSALSVRMDIHANEEDYSVRELRARIEDLEKNQADIVAAAQKQTAIVGRIIDILVFLDAVTTTHPERVK